MTRLRGVRALVVEDEPLLSLAMLDMLTDLGCEIAGSAARLDRALALARDLEFDIALLDVNLGGSRIDPVAELIAARGLPIVFVTGYGVSGAPRHMTGSVLEKPYEPETLERALLLALGATDE
ncbi:MAG: response regulator [Alphaproteobacteria bacterium]